MTNTLYGEARQSANSRVKTLSLSMLEEKAKRRQGPGSMTEAMGSQNSAMSGFTSADVRNQRVYGYYRGWPYAVIHAVARRVAAQPWGAGIMGSVKPTEERRLSGVQSKRLRQWNCLKAAVDPNELEVQPDHDCLKLLARPNQLQHKWDFLYLSAVNILLTGESYWVMAETDGELEVWSLPTHWVRPKHTDGLFSAYEITMGQSNGFPWPAEYIARTYMPSPYDPRQAMSPMQAIIASVQIDDAIVDSQKQAFDRGIFPNLIVTVGRRVGPDGKLTDVRPSLTMAQRSQMIRAIRQIWSQSVNAGDPAIIDGFIESIHKLSNAPQEMDWLTSSEMIRKRIMVNFGINEIVLGETQNANRAAAVVAEQSVCANSVNPLVSAFSETATEFFGPKYDDAGKLVIWLEPSEPTDPDLELSRWTAARQVGDVTRTEFRSEILGLPPLEDDSEQKYRNPLMESVGGMQGAVQVLTGVSQGMIEREAGSRLLQLFLQIPKRDADEIAGVGKEQEEPEPQPVIPPQEPPPQETQEEDEEDVGRQEPLEEVRSVKYDPNQPRDEQGRWGEGGGAGGVGGISSGAGKPSGTSAERSSVFTDDPTTISVNRTVYKQVADKLADEMGVSRSAIVFAKEDPPTNQLGGKTMRANAKYDPKTGKITFYPNAMRLKDPATFKAVAAHEMQHARTTETVMKMRNELTALQKETGGRMTPQVAAKYPTVAAIGKFFGDPNTVAALEKEDGVTEYSKLHWKEAAANPSHRFTAITETLSELARVASYTGTGKAGKTFVALYHAVNDDYRRTHKKAAASSEEWQFEREIVFVLHDKTTAVNESFEPTEDGVLHVAPSFVMVVEEADDSKSVKGSVAEQAKPRRLTRSDIKAIKADQTAKVQKEVGRVAAQHFQELRGVCCSSGSEDRSDA